MHLLKNVSGIIEDVDDLNESDIIGDVDDDSSKGGIIDKTFRDLNNFFSKPTKK
jgi:hypothetical protein